MSIPRPIWQENEKPVPLPLRVAKKFAYRFLPAKLYELSRYLGIEFHWYLKYLTQDTWYKNAPLYLNSLKGLSGLEIGGPSWLLKTRIPIYRVIKDLDNVNWSPVTLNNPTMYDGPREFRWFFLKRGRNIICEADELRMTDSFYDFVVSVQVIEHFANPLKALKEWKRVIRKGGFLVCEVPYKEITFDYKRSVTTFDHILSDYANNIGHGDLTHVDEVVELTDDFRTPTYKNKAELRKICEDNEANRLMHHHVFDLELLVSVIKEAGFDVLDANKIDSGLVVLARNIS